MTISFVSRFQLIVVYLVSQIVFLIIAFIMTLFSLIYLINLFYIQADPLAYFWDISIEFIIVVMLGIFCFYISFVNFILNALKFGKTKIAGKIIESSSLIPLETKLFYYNIIGETYKALDIANLLTKDPKQSKFDKKHTTKIYVIDAFLNAKKYKKAQIIAYLDIIHLEADIITAKRAMVVHKKDKNKDEAIKLALEAIEINKNLPIRNSDPKLFELNLILAEIYQDYSLLDDSFNVLKPLVEMLDKFPFYSRCKYSCFNISQCYYLYAKLLSLQGVDSSEVKKYANKSISSFKNSLYATLSMKLIS